MFAHCLCSAYFVQMIICFPKMFLSIWSNFLPVQSKDDRFWVEKFCFQFTPQPSFLIFLLQGVWAKCKFCLLTWYTFSVLSTVVMFIILNHFLFTRSLPFHPSILSCFVVFNSLGNKLHRCTNISISKVIDPYNLPMYHVVLSFCYLIVFIFVLSPRMSLL